jgi:arylsulfatase A-like enzyme/Tfp pilus assembly protein PilF
MAVIRWFVLAAAIATSALVVSAQTPATEVKYPNIILITLDTTRADRMDFLGSKRGLTPNLDLLAKDSAIFTRAYSQAPLTPASHSTIFTGTYPQYHQVLTFPIPLAKDLPYLPDILHAHGYATAAFVGSIAVDYKWGVPGFERGYDSYDAGYNWDAYTPPRRYQTVERRGDVVVEHALNWLNKDWLSQHKQQPFFIWVHLFDAHSPYDPPEPYKTRYAKALYDGEIAYVDSAMGKFFRQLKASGLYDETVVALTADHGESLGAHGEEEHGILLYDETIHVPLLIKMPKGASKGERIEERVELADIMPTLLQKVGIEVPEKVQGQSLLGFVEPGSPAGAAAAKVWQDRGAYSQADYSHIAFDWSALQSIRTGKYLFIQAPRRELYEDAIDPGAKDNLAAKSPAVADTLAANMRAFEDKTANKQETPKAKMDEAKMKKLAVLGYMAARADSPFAAPHDAGADPKDKIEVANTVLRINNLLQNLAPGTRCDIAIPELKKAVVSYPEISMLQFFLGGCYLDKNDYIDAIAPLRAAVKLDPGFTHAELNLGRALMQTGDFAGAAPEFEHVEKSEPNILETHIFLIVIYGKLGRIEDQIKECHAVLKVLPDNWGANLNLGRALAKTGDLEGAIATLQKAASLRPDSPQPHIELADIYAKMGRDEDAKRERAEAERLGAAPKGPITPSPDAAPESNPSQPN